jgi:hypothetical protein
VDKRTLQDRLEEGERLAARFGADPLGCQGAGELLDTLWPDAKERESSELRQQVTVEKPAVGLLRLRRQTMSLLLPPESSEIV